MNNKKKVLITGATGMVGSYMIEYILDNHLDWDIVACRRRHSDTTNVEHLLNQAGITWTQVDLIDAHEVEEMIKWFEPQKIFHLAAQSFVPRSWKAPVETIQVNVIGTINLFEACRKYCPTTIIHQAGSSEEYGLVFPEETPITEENVLRPQSPYACSKIMQENLGRTYHQSYGLRVITTRAFNHTGVRRGEEFVLSQIAKQAAEINVGIKDSFVLGNLKAKRDFTDVRDIVRAYWLASEKCNPGESYNICSGIAYSIEELLFMVKEAAGLLDASVIKDQSRMRPADVPILLGSCDKFKEATNWIIEFNIKDTIVGMYENWLYKLGGGIAEQIY